jgi:hypothetical protein
MAYPNPTIQAWRFREDNGNERTIPYGGATWIADPNTPVTRSTDTVTRIRFALYRPPVPPWEPSYLTDDGYRLQYKLNSSSWTNVTATSSVVRAAPTGNLVDGADTTRQLVSTGYNFVPNNDQVDDIHGFTESVKMASSNSVDIEYSFVVRSQDVDPGDVIQLRIVDTRYSQEMARIAPFSDASLTVAGMFYLSFNDSLGLGDELARAQDVVLSQVLSFGDRFSGFIPLDFYLTLWEPLDVLDTVEPAGIAPVPCRIGGATSPTLGTDGATTPLMSISGETK